MNMRPRHAAGLLVICVLFAGLAFYALPHLQDNKQVDPEHAAAYPDIPGRWHPRRDMDRTEQNNAELAKKMNKLRSLGYVAGSRAEVSNTTHTGLILSDPDLSWPGLNVVVSAHRPEIALYGQDGNILHRWTADYFAIWPDTDPATTTNGTAFFRNVHLLPSGEILAIFEWEAIVKLDADSKVIWALPNMSHHDLAVCDNGDIIVLTRKDHIIPRISLTDPVREDFLTRLDRDGNFLYEVSLLECLENSSYQTILNDQVKHAGDILHTNTVHLLDGSLSSLIPAFAAGNILTSFRNLDTIAVIDMERGKTVWAVKGDFHMQHDPHILPSGNLLLFNNNSRIDGSEIGHSRVEEYDPLTMTKVWSYGGKDTDLYSKSCGMTQRLPNGNTLITESDNGRAIEVTPDGKIVWEFINPNVAGEGNSFVATLLHVFRLPQNYDLGWLAEHEQPQ